MWRLLLVFAAVFAGAALAFVGSTDPQARRSLTGTDGSVVGPDTVTVTIPEGSFLGQCAVVTPPVGDPCEVAGQMLQYSFLAEVGMAAYHRKWVHDNPGENARLQAHLANPQCVVGYQGPVQDMKTYWGAALFVITQAIACLPQDPRHPRGAPTITIPPPLDPKRSDKTPPSAPGPITVTP